jgi:hypothetical protein
MTSRLFNVLTQFCGECLNGSAPICATPGCLHYARSRIGQPLGAVVRLLGGKVHPMPDRENFDVDDGRRGPRDASPGKSLSLLLELHRRGPLSLGQLAEGVLGKNSARHRDRVKGRLKYFRDHIEPLGDGVWKLVSIPEKLRVYLATLDNAEAAE